MAPSLKDALDRYLRAHKGINLAGYVMDRREETPPLSWSAIATDIYKDTDGIFEISYEALRTWAMDWTEGEAA